ncbi:MAG: thioredoxin domain-containing protein [Actinobacteria bacterium]|nr:thioredoxin domain-containing protein [Actinomycetota bacterium]
MAQKSGGDKVTRYLVIGMVIFVVLVGTIFSVMSNRSKTAAIPSTVSKADGYGIVFNGDVKGKTVDIWEDLQCPICQQFESINGAYIKDLVDAKKTKVVFHLLSFIGTESVLAANSLACAADEGKFLQMHAYLYAHQGKENTGTWSNAALIKSGAAVGLTSSKFVSCVDKGTYTGWVANVANDGSAQNVTSTPTVKVNGKEIDRNTQYMDAAAFKKAVEG